ncbi:inx [Lepeophtheirus salmonis]|uniref:Innexin n=1 Tax=Lepeophtheirus salmonis TaxID=72036 RepID=A0A7R8HA44_LEPSM|nr:inx [Lepeophtheirus salmonis]CAF2966701.1 inx [Lepeophtheirus salmonis]
MLTSKNTILSVTLKEEVCRVTQCLKLCAIITLRESTQAIRVVQMNCRSSFSIARSIVPWYVSMIHLNLFLVKMTVKKETIMAFLLSFSLIVTTRQYVGNPIDCVHTKDIPEDVLNTYCWIHSTYTIPSAFWKRIGIDVAHPGIDKTIDPEERRYVKYYQWVCFCLFFQAIFFYVPRWLWKNWEGGKITSLKMDLDSGIINESEKRQKKKLLLDYLYSNLKNHNFYAYRYFFCEFLGLINIMGQMLLMDKFFDGTFLTFGIEVISFAERDQEDRIDPMVYIFPRMTKCTFHKFGTSGEVEKHDAMCILPLNIVNEKIYIFLWFWMLIMFVLTFMVLVNSNPLNYKDELPYADKPQRFSLAKPCSKWTGTLDCTKESKMGYQPNPMFFESTFLYHGFPDDCLYLNVFTPILKEDSFDLLPVIVYFHGGAFILGGKRYEDICFQNSDCPGNQGMHDQILSLMWVQSHIHHFGGTSSNVTIMGQSAGGMSSLYHLASPLSKGLFHKIICLSGAVMYAPFVHIDRDPWDYAKAFAESLGVNDVFLLASCPWKPCVDVSQGKGNPVESILMGYTAQDGLSSLIEVMRYPNIWGLIQKDWSQIAPILFFNRERDNVTEEDRTAVEKMHSIENGNNVFHSNYLFMQLLNYFIAMAFKSNLFGRSFNINMYQDASYGAAHGDELLYMFSLKIPGLSKSLTTEKDRITSNNLRNTILSFVHVGKPTEKLNQDGHSQWQTIFGNSSKVNVVLMNDRTEEEDCVMDKEFDSERCDHFLT